MMGREYFVKKLYRIISQYDYDKCSHLACLEWDNTTASATAKVDIENPVEVEFNGEKFKAAANIDFYLTHAYGDYMTPPPEKIESIIIYTSHIENLIAYESSYSRDAGRSGKLWRIRELGRESAWSPLPEKCGIHSVLFQ